MEKSDPKFPNKFLIIGMLFLFTGGLLLMWTQGLLPGFTTLWPLPVIIAGMTFLYLAFLRRKTEILILPGMFMTLGGILLLLLNTVLSKSGFIKIWPGFMLITGISLIPYGFKKKARSRIVIIIPAVTIIVLSFIFFPFSLGISPISFSDFVSRWWPVILISIGIFFLSSYTYTTRNKKK